MVAAKREKFSSQADPKVLGAVRQIAESEGRQFQSVLEEALAFYVEQHNSSKIRPAIMEHFRSSVKKNQKLGELLAK